jgi:hypothetical protein
LEDAMEQPSGYSVHHLDILDASEGQPLPVHGPRKLTISVFV